MKPTFKTLLATLLLFFITTVIMAQDKFEYAIIEYTPAARDIQISINGVEFKKVDVPKEKIKGWADANPALEELNKMIDKGWELFDTQHSTGNTDAVHIFVFYLRKKKN
jgi:hypothetical protein